jgi:hypothetical protein
VRDIFRDAEQEVETLDVGLDCQEQNLFPLFDTFCERLL